MSRNSLRKSIQTSKEARQLPDIRGSGDLARKRETDLFAVARSAKADQRMIFSPVGAVRSVNSRSTAPRLWLTM